MTKRKPKKPNHRIVTRAECVTAMIAAGYEHPEMSVSIAIAFGGWVMVGTEWLYVTKETP